MLHVDKVEPVKTDRIQVNGHDDKELLYNWLEQLLLKFEIDSMAYSKFEVSPITRNVTAASVRATIHGETYDPQKHGAKVEVKGVTYHLMEIETNLRQARVRFLLDL